jgi:hypothetical protein
MKAAHGRRRAINIVVAIAPPVACAPLPYCASIFTISRVVYVSGTTFSSFLEYVYGLKFDCGLHVFQTVQFNSQKYTLSFGYIRIFLCHNFIEMR